MYRYFKTTAGVANGSCNYYWQCKGLSDEKINSIKTPNHGYYSERNLPWYSNKSRI